MAPRRWFDVSQQAVRVTLAACVVFTLSANTGGDRERLLRHADGPPVGHTGGFGEPTCQACHWEFETRLQSDSLVVEGFPDRYEPGEPYAIAITIFSNDMVASGFQAAARFQTGINRGGSAGRFVTVDQHVAVRRAPDTGVDYLHHTRRGSQIPMGGVATWHAVWVAPYDTAHVILHVAVNDGNGDNSPLGDIVHTSSVVSKSRTSDIR